MSRASAGVRVDGYCHSRFEAVAEEFSKNFAEHREIGAAVSIYLEGECVVDLWGGVADQVSARPWTRDTLAVAFSSTKGLVAICMHLLIQRGLLDLDAPVGRYWPEFACNGKEGITVAMVLAHQAGLPVWQQTLPAGALLDWDLVTGQLAAEQPLWEPGTQHGYHAVTIGYLEGELVRRVTGKSIGEYLRAEVAVPLAADIWIGCPREEHHRIATSYFADPNPQSPFFAKLAREPDWVGAKLINNIGGDLAPASINGAARRSAEIPAAGGIVTAHGLARAYAPLSLDGSIDGIRLFDEDMLPLMRTTRSASSMDTMLRIPTTFTLGFSKSWGAYALGEGEHVILGENAFGTPGFGGSIGFADGDARLAFGYVMNFHGPGVGLNRRGQSLIDATYRTLGFRPGRTNAWVR